MTEIRVRRRGATSTEPVNEDNPLPVSQAVAAPLEYNDGESITVSSTALPLTKAGNHTIAFITVETSSVRYWVDGRLPTASVGHQLDDGDALTLESAHEVANFRVIRVGGSDATLRVSYGR